MEDFNPKGFATVGKINGVPVHKKTKPVYSQMVGRCKRNMERPELKRKTRVNPNLLNLETPGAGPLERPTCHVFETKEDGGNK